MAEIVLKSGDVVLVDDDDFAWLSRWKWKLHKEGYACRTGWDKVRQAWTCVLMHRVIVQPADGLEVDHINRQRLDNRRGNLREVTHQENCANTDRVYVLRYPDQKVCEWCGAEYQPNPRKRKRQKTCSPTCATAMRNHNMSLTKRRAA
jgi:hypothetical protein